MAAICTTLFTYDYFKKATVAVYIPLYIGAIITTYYFNLTALTDAGILPRRDVDLILQQQQETIDLEQLTKQAKVEQYKKYHNLNQFSQKFKQIQLCRTCGIEKPVGTAHCSECDCCVVLQDHHCPWMGNCIGVRNYYYFFIGCCSVAAFCFLEAIYNLFGILFIAQWDEPQNPILPVSKSLRIIIILVFTFAALFGFLFGLSIFTSHLSYIRKDNTTRNELKMQMNRKQQIQLEYQDDIEFDTFVNQIRQNDPILSKLDWKKEMNSGWRRMKYGRFMPVLRNLEPQQAEELAWKWTIALSH